MDEENSYAVDVVGVFDSDFNQIFPEARPIKASVREAAKVMEHPVEDGSTITDHRVIEPTEIELTVLLTNEEFRDTYNKIRTYFRQTETLIVQTYTGSYPDMIIEAMPHDESGGDVGMIPIALKLREVLLVTAQFQALPPAAVAPGANGAGKRNASTVKRGEQTGKTETPTQTGGEKKSSTLYDIFYGGGGG
jgi:Dit-like tail protein